MNDKNVHHVAMENTLYNLEKEGIDSYLEPALSRLKKVCWDSAKKELKEGENPKIYIKMTLNVEVVDE